MDTYLRAWTEQDPDLATTIFTEDAVYQEWALGEPIRGRGNIRRYWQSKVVESQRDINCELLNLYLDAATGIAEWDVLFYDVAAQARKRMREVALFVVDDMKIATFREYWSCEVVPDAECAPPGHRKPDAP